LPTRPIRRQHEETNIPELRGATCSAFKAVQTTTFIVLLFVRLDEARHRFYLDAGLLFWDEGSAPDAEGDLLDGEAYRDLAVELDVLEKTVDEIIMRDDHLTLTFRNGARLVLKEGVRDEGTTIVELIASR